MQGEGTPDDDVSLRDQSESHAVHQQVEVVSGRCVPELEERGAIRHALQDYGDLRSWA
jgi:hypothetical protein